MSNVDMLNETVALIRERAEAAPPGPWFADEAGYRPPQWPENMQYRRVVRGEPHDVSGWRVPVLSTHGAFDDTTQARVTAGIVEHAASWHPDVALAVADWLATVADLMEHGDAAGPLLQEKALAFARRYLGRDA